MKSLNICPFCKAILAFDRAVLSVVKCPQCAYTGKVTDFKETVSKSTVKEPVLETEHNPSANNFYTPGKLELVETDAQWLQAERTVNLQKGVNTLGRMSPDSSTTLQLPTTDSFMSRGHAKIEVIMKTDGVFEHRLSDLGSSKNGTFHNGERLEKGDVIKLLQNDTIKVGHTLLRLIDE